uniref:Reverse transcriptase domain-containing protein n=1 Tax=Tanacetum cinerariifolium TaxID=118510 RepID=A0A6L2M240_TANCI|nr:reverse transcriptase domain-containing protein [Tanacetum cinerariifolium]
MSHHKAIFDTPSLTKKVFANMKRVERLEEENRVLKEHKGVHSTVDFDEPFMEMEESSKQERKIVDIDVDVEINLEKVQAEAYNLDLDHQEKVLSMLDVNDEKLADVKEVLEVVKAAKLVTKVVTTAGVDVNAARVQDTPITAAEGTKAYKNSLIYKERTKKLHDDKIKNRIFNVGDQVLLFNSRLKIFSGKLKSCWSGPFTIFEIYPYGTAKLIHPDGCNFKVNCHPLKHYHGGDPPPLEIPDEWIVLKFAKINQKQDNIYTRSEATKKAGSEIREKLLRPQLVGFGDLNRTLLTKGNSQNVIDDKGYWDSCCSRHMTGNISFLSDYDPYDGGYVSFRQGGGKITSKVVVAGTSSTNFLGTKDDVSQDVKKDMSSLRYITLLNWFHDAHLESSISNAQDACNVDAPESSGNSNPTDTSTNPLIDQLETLTVESAILTVSSPIPTVCLDDTPEPTSDTRIISKRVTSQDDTPSLDNILTLSNRFEDILGVTTNTCDTNGVEADLGNMQYNISVSPTPAFRIHQDHLKIARIEAIRLFLAYASFMGFTFYKMDVKSAFLYGTIDEEVYVMQPPGFQDPKFLARVYKVEKAIHYLSEGTEEISNFYKSSRPDIMFVVCAYARHQVTPKECHLHAVKRIFRYLKDHPKLGLWYPKQSPFDLVAYSDSDYGGATQDWKSTTRGC